MLKTHYRAPGSQNGSQALATIIFYLEMIEGVVGGREEVPMKLRMTLHFSSCLHLLRAGITHTTMLGLCRAGGVTQGPMLGKHSAN